MVSNMIIDIIDIPFCKGENLPGQTDRGGLV